MSAVSGYLPNLIGGVSQQPPEIRALNTSTALTNTWSSVISGLGTRPGTEFISKIEATLGDNETLGLHGIVKSTGTYAIAIGGGTVHVVNLLTGELQTVTVEDDADDYINENDAAVNLRFTTIGDTTFILNRTVQTAVTYSAEGSGLTGNTDDEVVRRNPNRFATYWVKQYPGYATTYALYLNSVLYASASSAGDPIGITTAMRSSLDSAGATYAAITGTITSITLDNETDFMVHSDGYGEQASYAYNDFVEEFTDLPKADKTGRLVMVKQDADDSGDDYWVWYKGGSWEETYGWNSYELPDPDTMPVVLVDNLDGTWTLKKYEWSGRTVGDTDSNATPSFVGNVINDMFRFKGRLAFLSGENVIMSQKGTLENFYRTTCSQLLDEDRIDIAGGESRGSDLVGARPFQDGLLVFSENDQFYLHGDSENLISPNTAEMNLVNTYTASGDLQPTAVGPNVVFVDDPSDGLSKYSQLREYQIERVFGQQTAPSITDQIPEYIPSGVYRMITVPQKSAVLLASSGALQNVFSYNYYYNNDGKVQSSWQKWAYDGRVLNICLVRDALYIFIQRNSVIHVIRQRFSEGVAPYITEEDVLLDYRVSSEDVLVSYDGTNTTVTMPYALTDFSDYIGVISPDNTGDRVIGQTYQASETLSSGSSLVFRNVDLSSDQFFIGQTFEFDWTLSPMYLRDDKMVVVQDGRLQIGRVGLLYNQSGPFKVYVTPIGRDAYAKNFSGVTIGDQNDTLGAISLDSGKAEFSADGEAGETTIRVVGKTPWRVRFSSLEWTGTYRAKTQRTG